MEELKPIRERKALSQAMLAQLAGLNPVTVHRIENGYKSPTVKTLESLAQVLGVEVGDFFPKVQPALPLEERPPVNISAASGGAGGISIDEKALRRVLTLVSQQKLSVEEGMRDLVA